MTCHTQIVQRTVKLVTESSSQACSQDAREGIIVTTLASRKRMPAFKSKKDYVPINCKLFQLYNYGVFFFKLQNVQKRNSIED